MVEGEVALHADTEADARAKMVIYVVEHTRVTLSWSP